MKYFIYFDSWKWRHDWTTKERADAVDTADTIESAEGICIDLDREAGIEED